MGDNAVEEIPAATDAPAKYIPANGVLLMNLQEITKGHSLLKAVGLRSESETVKGNAHQNDCTKAERHNAGNESEGYQSDASDGDEEEVKKEESSSVDPIPIAGIPEECPVLAASPGGGLMEQILNAKLKSAKQPDDGLSNQIEDEVKVEAENPLTKELKEILKSKVSRPMVNIDSLLEKQKAEKCKESVLSPDTKKIKDSAQNRSTLAEEIDERRRKNLEKMKTPTESENSEGASTKPNPFACLRRNVSQRLPQPALALASSSAPPSQQLLKKRSLPTSNKVSVTATDKDNWLNEIQSKAQKRALNPPSIPAKPIKKSTHPDQVDGRLPAMLSLPRDNPETKHNHFSQTSCTLSDDDDSKAVGFVLPPPPTDAKIDDGGDLDLPLPPPPTMEDLVDSALSHSGPLLPSQNPIPFPAQQDALLSENPIPLLAPQDPLPSKNPIHFPAQQDALLSENPIPLSAPLDPLPSKNPIPLPAPQDPLPSNNPIPLSAPLDPLLSKNPIHFPAQQDALLSENPIPLPAPQDPLPSNNPIPLSAPLDPLPSKNPIPLPAVPAPQDPLPSKNPIPLPAPQDPLPSKNPIPLPAPQDPLPSKNPIPLPVPQDPLPSKNPIPLPAPQDPLPSKKPLLLPAPSKPPRTSPETLSTSLLPPQEPSTALMISSEHQTPPEPLVTPSEPSSALLTVTQPELPTCNPTLSPQPPHLALTQLEPSNLLATPPQSTYFKPPPPPPPPMPTVSKKPDLQSALLSQIQNGFKLKRPEEHTRPKHKQPSPRSPDACNFQDIFDRAIPPSPNLKEILENRRTCIDPDDPDEFDNDRANSEWEE